LVINSIKGGRKIKENKSRNMLIINGQKKIILNT